MALIKDIFQLPVDRRIEEVIKVDQHDEEVVLNEIQEYVLTDAIKEHFYTIYDHVAQYQYDPHEGIGVWVSGFFGSGKSSFAKLVGYTLMNRMLGGKPAAECFIEHARDSKISSYLKNIISRYHIHAVIFDVSMDRGVKSGSDRITEVMYKVLLRELNYPEDLDLAELEITLEEHEELEKFKRLYEETYGKPWNKGKKVFAHALVEAGQILHKLYPDKYTTPESFVHTIGPQGRADIDANKLARRTFDLVARRKPGYGIIYIIDEVGQYVSRSTDKMLDLQGVVQALGKESRNRVKRGEAQVPAWLIVTSQEKLEEVVDALDQHRIELARLQDRFPIAIDLKQSDIQEVTAKRVLLKTREAEKILAELFDRNEGRLKTHCTLERTHRRTTFTREEFIQLYPYLPYQIELSIDIVAGLRLKRGAQRHIGGSNRTIIKQAQQILIHPNIRLADQPLGALVTLDKIYDLLYSGSLLPMEMTREIDEIPNRIAGNEMVLKVAKAIALLEVVRDLPRTTHNIAAVLHPAVNADSIESEVEQTIESLLDARFIRETEEGYKLLTVAEKDWDTVRNSKSPKPRQKDELLVEFFKDIFSEPALRTFRYKTVKTFRTEIYINNQKIEDGDITIHFMSADNNEEINHLKEFVRKESRTPDNQDHIYWVFGLTENLHNLFTEVFRSRAMIQEYGRLRSQQQITREEGALLDDEQQREQRFSQQLKAALIKAVENGTVIFRGLYQESNLLGNRLSEQMRKALEKFVPDIYPKLEMGARPMSGKEAEEVLKAANLQALSNIFYEEPQGLNLIHKQGDKFLPNMNAPVVREVFNYLKREHDYGNKVTGKSLELDFSAPPYGWERDLIRLILAVIFRANQLEITYQGQRFKSYQEPAARVPLTNQTAFRSATFAPKEGVDLRTIKRAAENIESITGEFADMDETTLATAFQEIAREDQSLLKDVLHIIRQFELPGEELLVDFQNTIENILRSASDDCVKILAGEGKSYKKTRDFLRLLKGKFTENNISLLKKGKHIIQKVWPVLKSAGFDGELAERAQRLRDYYLSESLYNQLEAVRIEAEAIWKVYQDIYTQKHQNRNKEIQRILETIKADPNFSTLTETQQSQILTPITRRLCQHLLLEDDEVCQNCRATLQQLESDILSASKLLDITLKQINNWTADEEKVISISVKDFLRGEYKSIEEIEEAVQRLKDRLIKIFLDGKRVFLE